MKKHDALVVGVLDGKYTVVQDNKGKIFALRYGEKWRDCCGDGLILALAQEIYELRQKAKIANAVAEAVMELPFGKTTALPWCRESFPELNDAMNEVKKLYQSEQFPPIKVNTKGVITFCPECGFGVKVDEDGCCCCGALAVGNAVEELYNNPEYAAILEGV